MPFNPPGSPLNYPANDVDPIRIIKVNRAPTSNDSLNFNVRDFWIDESLDDLWFLIDKGPSGAFWIKLGGAAAGDIHTLTGDSGGSVAPDLLGNVDVLGNPDIDVVGTPASSSFQLTNLTKITEYIVDPTPGKAPYSTIQSAMDAANLAGGGLVFARVGTYVENLTFYSGVDLVGIGDIFTGAQKTQIVGQHVPPTTGTLSVSNIAFTGLPVSDIFTSVAAGSAGLTFTYCNPLLSGAYFLNLPNWTGEINYIDCTAPRLSLDGFINNATGSSDVYCVRSGVGAGIGIQAEFRGNCILFQCNTICNMNFGGAGTTTSITASGLNGTISTQDSTQLFLLGNFVQTFLIGPVVAINHLSSGFLLLSSTIIVATAVPYVITGTGPISYNSTQFVAAAGIDPGLGEVTAFNSTTKCPNFLAWNAILDPFTTSDSYLRFDIAAANKFCVGVDQTDAESFKITNGATPSAGSEHFEIKAAGDITFNSAYEFPTADGSAGQVLTTDGAGNVDFQTPSGGFGFTWNEVTGTSGALVDKNGYVTNNAALVTMTLPATAAFGEAYFVVGKGAGGWKIAQNAGQTIHFLSSDTTTGAGGSLDSTGQYDFVAILCTAANTDFTIIDSGGSITIT